MSAKCPKCGNKLQLMYFSDDTDGILHYQWYGICGCGFRTKGYETQLEAIEFLEKDKPKHSFITYSSSCG